MASDEETPGPGRPQKTLTQKQIHQLESLAGYLTVEEIADFLGISRTTFYKLCKEDETINEHYKRGRAKRIARYASQLTKKAEAGDLGAIIFYLKTQGRWSSQHNVDLTNSDSSLAPTVITLVTPEFDDDDPNDV